MPKQSLYDVRTAFDLAVVLGWRLPMLAISMADPSPARRGETLRMVTEKQQAFVLGLIGAQQALMQAWLTGALDGNRVASEVMAAAHAPALKTLRSNAQRISRKRSY